MYEKGKSFEKYVKKLLKRQGYLVIRAASSKPIDLVAIKDGKVILVECKFRNYLSPEDKEKLRKIAEITKIDILIATHENGRVVLRKPD